jgi:NADH:ubiquinone oxidoreductase subunit E
VVLACAAAGIVALAAGVMTVDHARATLAAPGEAARLAALQRDAEGSAAAAALVAAEQDRVTRARQARRARAYALGLVVLFAGAGFVTAMKWRIAMEGRRPAVAVPVPAAAPPPRSERLARTARRSRRARIDVETDPGWVDEIVRREGTGREAVVPILQAIQAHARYLPDRALQRVCEITEITPAQIAGASSFYATFRRSPMGEHLVRVCHGTACHVAGARQITEELRRQLRIPDGSDTDPTRTYTLGEVACLGCCSLAPVVMVDGETAGRLTPASAVATLDVPAGEPA